MSSLFTPYASAPSHYQPVASPGDMRYRNPDNLAPVMHPQDARKRTTSPIVTGTSVIALRYATGVVIACDTLGSYGTLARFMHFERIRQYGDFVVAGGGDLSDLQFIFDELDALRTREFVHDDGHSLSAKSVWNYMTRVLYERRNKGDPLYVQLIFAAPSFLACVDLHGTAYCDRSLASGFGAHLARPLLRLAEREDLAQADAKKVVEDAMRVLFYRDCKTINKVQIATVDESGVTIEAPRELSTSWEVGNRPADPRGSW